MLETMSGTFNGQILVEKLGKLNSSQQSIETLSHWCIFHMKKAKEVVETWDSQFHCSPREQRLSFLYLANDILQNSRKKGSEFVDEFWKVLPAALTDVTENGDGSGRNAARRLTDIWDERKVFGSRGKVLKEAIMGRNLENRKKDGKIVGFKTKQSIGSILEKIISGYEVIYDRSEDEEALLSKCREAVKCVDKVKNELGGDRNSAPVNGSDFVEELQGQHGILGKCIEQLRVAESSRSTLVSHLKEALQQQELELEQVRTQLQAAQSQSEQAGNICQQLLQSYSNQSLSEQRSKEGNTFSDLSSSFTPENLATSGSKERSAPVMYTRQAPAPSFPNNTPQSEEDPRKSAAAAVVAKLTASTSSAQMLTYVLSSLASEGVNGKSLNDSSDDYPSEKRQRLETPQSSYMQPSQQPQQPPPPPFPHPDSFHPPQPPPPSSSPLPPVPYTPPTSHFMQTAGSMTSVPYSYGSAPQRPPPLPGYPMPGPGAPLTGMPPYPSPPNPYQNFQGSGSGFYSNPPSLPATPPISRQQISKSS